MNSEDLKNRKFEVGDKVLDKRDVKEVTAVLPGGFMLNRKDGIIPWHLQKNYPLMMIPAKKGEEEKLNDPADPFDADQIMSEIRNTGTAFLKSIPEREPRTYVEVQEKNQTFGEAMANFDKGWGIKVPEWRGYWFLKGGRIWVRLEDGSTNDTPWYHENVLRQDWQSGPIMPVGLSREEINKLMQL